MPAMMSSYYASVIPEKTRIGEGGNGGCPRGAEGLEMGGLLELWTPKAELELKGRS